MPIEELTESRSDTQAQVQSPSEHNSYFRITDYFGKQM